MTSQIILFILIRSCLVRYTEIIFHWYRTVRSQASTRSLICKCTLLNYYCETVSTCGTTSITFVKRDFSYYSLFYFQGNRFQPTLLRLQSSVVGGMDKKRFHRVGHSQMCRTFVHERQTPLVHARFEFRLQRSVHRRRLADTLGVFVDKKMLFSCTIFQNRSAKKSCPSVTRATPTRVRTKGSASLCRKDSTSAGAIPVITANIAKTWLTRVTVTRAGTRELANCSKKEDSGKYRRTRRMPDRNICRNNNKKKNSFYFSSRNDFPWLKYCQRLSNIKVQI